MKNTFRTVAVFSSPGAKMEPVRVDKYAVPLTEGIQLAVYLVGHFPFQYDGKFQVRVPMAAGPVIQKA
jgi:hypothetical protein